MFATPFDVPFWMADEFSLLRSIQTRWRVGEGGRRVALMPACAKACAGAFR